MKLSISRLFAIAAIVTGLSLVVAAPAPEPLAPQGRIAALARARRRAAMARHAFRVAHRRFPRDLEEADQYSESGKAEKPVSVVLRPRASHVKKAVEEVHEGSQDEESIEERAPGPILPPKPSDKGLAGEIGEGSKGEDIEERAIGPAGFHPGLRRFGPAARARAFRAARAARIARAARAARRIGRRDEDDIEELVERAFGPAGFRPGARRFGPARAQALRAARLRALRAGRRFRPRDEESDELEARDDDIPEEQA